MGSLFWSLPGPTQFVERVASSMREGINPVILYPEYFPLFFKSAVRTAYGDHRVWTEINVSQYENALPVTVLLAHCGDPTALLTEANISTLINNEGFRGRVFWLNGFIESTWSEWSKFLETYAHVSGSEDKFERTVFVLMVPESWTEDEPQYDVRLAKHSWSGVVSRIDILLYASQRIETNFESQLRQTLALQLIAELALWDPFLVDFLSQRDLSELIQPLSLLAEFAIERGWTRDRLIEKRSKRGSGFCELFEGQVMTHSAALNLEKKNDELMARVWRAQVVVLLPYIETERRAFIFGEGKRFIKLPHQTAHGDSINKASELEFNHLAFIIAANPAAPEEIKMRINHLRNIRNELAHLKPLQLSLIP